jgi:fucose permease
MPGAAGTAVALAAGLGSLGGFLVPWLTGILAAHTDLAVALTSLSPWLLVLAIASAVIRRLQIR